MQVIRPKNFNGYTGISCGISTKLGQNRTAPYFFNMSYSVNDDPDYVNANREFFFASFGVKKENVAFQNQVHGDNVSFAARGGNCGDSDAMITNIQNLALVISTADCPPVFIYDPVNKAVGAVHSGWRSTQKELVSKTIKAMCLEFSSLPEELLVYIGPAICGKCYEVGAEFIEKFDKNYLTPAGEKFKLDLQKRIIDQLLYAGLNRKNIQVSRHCTYENKDLLHSFRRDGAVSGRALGLIVMNR